MKKIAAHRIIFPDGTVLPLTVVILDDNNRLISTHPLCQEEPNVEFYHGDYRL